LIINDSNERIMIHVGSGLWCTLHKVCPHDIQDTQVQPTMLQKPFADIEAEYMKSKNSLKALQEALKNYPKSIDKLGDDFWKQFFDDHQLPYSTCETGGIRAINMMEEFKIQNMLKYFRQLSTKTCCCNQQACAGGESCLSCKNNINRSCEEELNVNNVDIIKFL